MSTDSDFIGAVKGPAINTRMVIVSKKDRLTLADTSVWLRTGVVSDDVAGFPDATTHIDADGLGTMIGTPIALTFKGFPVYVRIG